MKPTRNKDAVTESSALVELFAHYSVCTIIMPDTGAKFTSSVTQIITHSFAHHCLGAVAPYVKDRKDALLCEMTCLIYYK